MTSMRDSGQSMVEGIVLGLALFVPLIFGTVTASAVHRTTLAADSAARDAARAWTTSPTVGAASTRAEAAARSTAASFGFDANSVRVEVSGAVAPGAGGFVTVRLPVPHTAGFGDVTRRAAIDVDRFRATPLDWVPASRRPAPLPDQPAAPGPALSGASPEALRPPPSPR